MDAHRHKSMDVTCNGISPPRAASLDASAPTYFKLYPVTFESYKRATNSADKLGRSLVAQVVGLHNCSFDLN